MALTSARFKRYDLSNEELEQRLDGADRRRGEPRRRPGVARVADDLDERLEAQERQEFFKRLVT